MIPFFIYLIKVTVCSGLLYAYYNFVLRNRKFHYWNRYYLLVAVIASLLIPFLHIPLSFSHQEVQQSPVLKTLNIISSNGTEEEIAIPGENTSFWQQLTWKDGLIAIYILAGLFAFSGFVKGLINIQRLISSEKVQPMEDIYFVNSNAEGTPFSFFQYIFWNSNISFDSPEGKQIFKHELTHVHEKHSYDKIFIQLITVIFWCNPFFHIIKKELALIHEFIADHIASMNEDAAQYAEMVLWKATTGKQLSFTNNFFYKQLKRRIAMITTSQQTSHQYLRKVMVLPLAIILIVVFAFRYKSPAPPVLKPNKQITIVIDAGHGGEDDGAIGVNGLKEKGLTLQLAKIISELATQRNIKALMVRTDDTKVPLQERTKMAEDNHADAFISLHLETIPSTYSDKTAGGMEIYIAKQEFANRGKSEKMAQSVQSQISPLYKFNGIKTKQVGIWVVQAVSCPSILIACGYLSNKKDVDFIQQKENQVKLANSILDGVVNYLNDNDKASNNTLEDTIPRKNMYVDSKAKAIFFADTVISMEKKQTDWGNFETVYIMDGVPLDKSAIKNKSFTCSSITVYPANFKDAFETFGSLAKNSIVLIKDGKFYKDYPFKNERPVVDDDNIIFTKTEIEPSFPGGDKAWKSFVMLTINKNSAELIADKNSNGLLYLQFVVTKEGNTKDIIIIPLSMKDSKLAKIMSEAIANGPKWIPAKQNGRDVNSYQKVPVKYEMPGDKVASY